MKKLIAPAIAFLVALAMVYLCTSFIIMDFNPRALSEAGRFLMCWLGFGFGLIAAIAVYLFSQD